MDRTFLVNYTDAVATIVVPVALPSSLAGRKIVSVAVAVDKSKPIGPPVNGKFDLPLALTFTIEGLVSSVPAPTREFTLG